MAGGRGRGSWLEERRRAFRKKGGNRRRGIRRAFSEG